MKYYLDLPETLAPLVEQNRHPDETPEQCIERMLMCYLVEDQNLFVIQKSLDKFKEKGTEVVNSCYLCLSLDQGLYLWSDLETLPIEVYLGKSFFIGKTQTGIHFLDLAIALEKKTEQLVSVLEEATEPSLQGFWDDSVNTVLESIED